MKRKILLEEAAVGSLDSIQKKGHEMKMREEKGYRVLPLESVKFNPTNEYEQDNIEGLAWAIYNCDGLIHAIRVRPEEDGKYELVAGERRTRAFYYGRDNIGDPMNKGFDWNNIEATVRPMDDNMMRLQLLYENEADRDKNPARTRAAIIEIEKILSDMSNEEKQQVKEEVAAAKGKEVNQIKTRDIVGLKLGISGAQVDRMKSLDNLIPKLDELLNKNVIGKDDAYHYSQMTEDEQKMIAAHIEGGIAIGRKDAETIKQDLKNLKADSAKDLKQRDDKIIELETKLEEAQNTDNTVLMAQLEADLQKERDEKETFENQIKAEAEKLINEKVQELTAEQQKVQAYEKRIKELEEEVNNKKISPEEKLAYENEIKLGHIVESANKASDELYNHLYKMAMYKTYTEPSDDLRERIESFLVRKENLVKLISELYPRVENEEVTTSE